jgi:hypothetical protein
MKAQLRF